MKLKLKHIINHPVIRFILCVAGSFYIRLIYFTQRWDRHIPDAVKEITQNKKPVIFAFWHGRLLLAGMFSPSTMQNNVIISLHKDGEWIARIVRFLGQRIIRGSSSKGGASALKQAIQTLETSGQSLSITPDGPRGPRMRVSGNIIEIARRSGAPIVAFTYSTSRAKHLNSWDRFLLSHPFGKAIAIFGQPHYIKANASSDDMKHMKDMLEKDLIALTQKADKAMGHDIIFRLTTINIKGKALKNMLLFAYRILSIIGGPLIDAYLLKRKALGKEDSERLPERMGVPSATRPKGKLVWIHAASVGEALSVLPLMEAITSTYPNLNILLTTGTVTSAEIMKKRLPNRCYHQYVPIDRYLAVRKFLKYWRPDLALWVESEIWPNLLSETHKYCPMVLVNGRLSKESLKKWQRYPRFAATLMRFFTLVLPQSEEDSKRLKSLGAEEIKFLGNLKFDSPSLPSDSKKMGELVSMVGDRHLWVCASTHRGEELMIAEVHHRMKEHFNDLLTVIIPRHPTRADDIKKEISEAFSLEVAKRSAGEVIHDETDIYLADTMAELGVFYRLSPIVFVGGSLVEHGGQNPLEAARLECALIFGPFMDNFRDIASELQEKGGAIRVADASGLYEALSNLMRDTDQQQHLSDAAKKLAKDKAGVLSAYMEALKPHLEYLSKQSG